MNGAPYLNEGLDAGLEDHVGVEQEGAQEGLRVAGQLGHDAREQDVDVERVLEHVLQLGEQDHDEWTLSRGEKGGLVNEGHEQTDTTIVPVHKAA